MKIMLDAADSLPITCRCPYTSVVGIDGIRRMDGDIINIALRIHHITKQVIFMWLAGDTLMPYRNGTFKRRNGLQSPAVSSQVIFES